MAEVSIHLLGRFRARCDGRDLIGLDGARVRELLCYLLLHRDRILPRETLAGTLWGDGPTAKSRKQLRQAIWQLQAALHAQVPADGPRLLDVGSDWLRLNAGDHLWLDIAVIEHAYTESQGLRGKMLTPEGIAQLQKAVTLYDGDLLEGWYQDWCLFSRERLQAMYLSLLDKLMVACEAIKDYEAALAYGARVLAVDRAREYTHRRLMRLAYLEGDRTGALRQFERCRISLDQELGVEPGAATVALYEMICRDHLDDEPSATASSEVLGQLHHLRTMLEDLQRHLQQDIRIVDLALDQS